MKTIITILTAIGFGTIMYLSLAYACDVANIRNEREIHNYFIKGATLYLNGNYSDEPFQNQSIRDGANWAKFDKKEFHFSDKEILKMANEDDIFKSPDYIERTTAAPKWLWKLEPKY